MPETLAERIAEKYACAVNMDDKPFFVDPSPAMLERRGVKFDILLTKLAIRDFARELAGQIRAEANSIEEAILILKVAAGGEG